jgi:hypothetical protein
VIANSIVAPAIKLESAAIETGIKDFLKNHIKLYNYKVPGAERSALGGCVSELGLL